MRDVIHGDIGAHHCHTLVTTTHKVAENPKQSIINAEHSESGNLTFEGL